MFTTLFCGVIDVAAATLTYCNCGHNPPLLLRQGADAFETLRNCGPPLAVMDDIVYVPRTLALAPGDLLLLYTDGVTEAEDPQGAQFGMKRLQDAILSARGKPARLVVEHVVERVAAFANDAPQSDDITCVAVVALSPIVAAPPLPA
jgi:sigma-B regulation protein RsbU (phosphoserine phosphatase)